MIHPTRLCGVKAELLAAYRFLEAGQIVAWPLVPCAYDLLVDAGNACYRIQVKQAHTIGDMGNRWRTRLTKRRPTGDTPQPTADLDFFCIICTPDLAFVIPVAACASPVDARYINAQIEIGPESRYQRFRNSFVLGSGQSSEHIAILQGRPQPQPRGSYERNPHRKVHKRLSLAEIAEIRALPVYWGQGAVPIGKVSVTTIAAQFNVSPVTLRNLILHRRRQDLR